jgi:thiol-disulfide isomerase/thioredoxin
MPLRKQILIASSIALGLTLWTCACSRKTSDAGTLKAKPSTSAPLALVTGSELLQRVRKSGGRGVLINVWATWCGPCRSELPLLQRLSGKLGALGVPIWLLSIDDEYALPVAKALLETMHIDLPRMAAAPPIEALGATLNPAWPPGTVPASFLFDAQGNLVSSWAGAVRESELLLAVARLNPTQQ